MTVLVTLTLLVALLGIVCALLGTYVCVYLNAARNGETPHNFIVALGPAFNKAVMTSINGLIRRTGLVTRVMNREARQRLEKLKSVEGGRSLICYGDSEFGMWRYLESDVVVPGHTVLNAGFGGARTIDCLNNLHALCLAWKPSLILFHAAGNDWDYADRATHILPEFPRDVAKRILVIKTRVNETGAYFIYLHLPPKPAYTDAKASFYNNDVMTWLEFYKVPVLRMHDVPDMVKLYSDVNNYSVDQVHMLNLPHKRAGSLISNGISSYCKANEINISYS